MGNNSIESTLYDVELGKSYPKPIVDLEKAEEKPPKRYGPCKKHLKSTKKVSVY